LSAVGCTFPVGPALTYSTLVIFIFISGYR